MLLQIGPNLEEMLVELLASRAGATAQELQRNLPRKGRPYSFQAVYKSLAGLQRSGVLVKAGQEYTLKLSWITELLSLADKVRATHLDPSLSKLVLPAPGKSSSWNFTSLLRLDDFWAHLVLELFRFSPSKIMYEWIPHPWFELLHKTKEDKFRETIRRSRRRLHMIIGGDTFLDRHCSKYWPHELYRYSFAQGPFERDRSRYLDVIDDYILVIKLSAKLSEQIDQYFESVRDWRDFDLIALSRLIMQPAKARISIENNAAEASRLRKKFRDYFGDS